MGLVRVAEPRGRVGRRRAAGERFDGLLGRVICLIVRRVSPVARATRRWSVRAETPSTSPWSESATSGSRTTRRRRTRRSTNTSAFPGVGISQREPSSHTELGDAVGNVTARSTKHASGNAGANVPRLNTIPKNSASAGIGVTVALVSGPRTVSCVQSRWLVTTICQ